MSCHCVDRSRHCLDMQTPGHGQTNINIVLTLLDTVYTHQDCLERNKIIDTLYNGLNVCFCM